MFKKILIGIALVVLALCAIAAMQPSSYHISREVVIAAPAEVVFPFINNNRKTNDWMPWKDADPSAEMVFEGPEEGVGAITKWDSKGKMGTGQAEVIESVPNQSVKTKLTYQRPMAGTQEAEMTLSPAEGGTKVVWSVKGNNTFVGRLFCLFMNMEKMIGGEFEKGLAKLKSTVEAGK